MGLLGNHDHEAIQYLSSLNPTRVPLRTNCRNTRIILEEIQCSLAADMGCKGAGDGPQIRKHVASTLASAAEMLEREIKEIVEVGGIPPGNLTILSPFSFDQSSIALVSASVKRKVSILDEYSLRTFSPERISFAEIGNFKGLENEAIIVVDLPALDDAANNRAMHYVAMSRARAILSLIYLNVS